MRDGVSGSKRAIGAAGLALALALCLAGGPATAQIQIVSAGAEYETFHPRPHPEAAAGGGDFQAAMDRAFGAGRWRKTSGYRSQAQENALRRQGAGTVAPGHISYHSLGAPDAPHAYDAVVSGMSTASAAAKLKQAGGPFTRVLAEGKHGPQGAHLHIELAKTAPAAQAEAEPADDRADRRRRRHRDAASSADAAES